MYTVSLPRRAIYSGSFLLTGKQIMETQHTGHAIIPVRLTYAPQIQYIFFIIQQCPVTAKWFFWQLISQPRDTQWIRGHSLQTDYHYIVPQPDAGSSASVTRSSHYHVCS